MSAPTSGEDIPIEGRRVFLPRYPENTNSNRSTSYAEGIIIKYFKEDEVFEVFMLSDSSRRFWKGADVLQFCSPMPDYCASNIANIILRPDRVQGTRVKKYFDGIGYYGTVTGFDDKFGWFSVEYDDGDKEDVELLQVCSMVFAGQSERYLGQPRAPPPPAHPKFQQVPPTAELLSSPVAHLQLFDKRNPPFFHQLFLAQSDEGYLGDTTRIKHANLSKRYRPLPDMDAVDEMDDDSEDTSASLFPRSLDHVAPPIPISTTTAKWYRGLKRPREVIVSTKQVRFQYDAWPFF